jgi:hypothetical protein
VVKVVEPGVGVGLQDAGIPGQVLVRVLAPAVARVVEQGGRRRRFSGRCWPNFAFRIMTSNSGPARPGAIG